MGCPLGMGGEAGVKLFLVRAHPSDAFHATVLEMQDWRDRYRAIVCPESFNFFLVAVLHQEHLQGDGLDALYLSHILEKYQSDNHPPENKNHC